MGVMKAGVPNGGVSGDSRYYTPDNNWPKGSSGTQFWSRGWGQTEETMKPGSKEKGGGQSKMMKRHSCMNCG